MKYQLGKNTHTEFIKAVERLTADPRYVVIGLKFLRTGESFFVNTERTISKVDYLCGAYSFTNRVSRQTTQMLPITLTGLSLSDSLGRYLTHLEYLCNNEYLLKITKLKPTA